MKETTRHNEAGFTLIEALIAMVILAVGLTAIANLFFVASSSSQVANKQTVTAAQASEAMERLKGIDFQALLAGDGLTGPTPACPGACADATNNDCVVPGTFQMCKQIPGVDPVLTRWQIQVGDRAPNAAGVNVPSLYFIDVQSEIQGPLGGTLTQARFSTMRACKTLGCP